MTTTDPGADARRVFEQAIQQEIDRRNKVVFFRNRQNLPQQQHVVMDFLAGAIPGAAVMNPSDRDQAIRRLAGRIVADLVGDRTGDVWIVSGEEPTVHYDAGHLHYDWHVGATSPGEVQHRTRFTPQP